MESYRRDLQNILVSEEEYHKLKVKPESKRNLKEFVWVRVFEEMRGLKTDLMKSQK